jgi:hypothetical protein
MQRRWAANAKKRWEKETAFQLGAKFLEAWVVRNKNLWLI